MILQCAQRICCENEYNKTSCFVLQFQTPKTAMETLFSIVNGDEIFATLAILEEDKSGGDWVFWFSRVYIGAYVAIFTIVVINLLIGIFMSAYETIKVTNYFSSRDTVFVKGSYVTHFVTFYLFNESTESTNSIPNASSQNTFDIVNQ